MKVHFLGIGGSGASAVASIAKAQGFEVSGCDKEPFNEFTQRFDKATLQTGHSKEHLENAELLVITPAILSLDPNNEELEEAKKRMIPIFTWQQFMGECLMKDKFVIAVCGTHGKSTTTAMIAQILEDANLDPTVELGAIVPKWGTNFRAGKSKYFITEADEFNDNYLHTKPNLVVVTNIEMDHPEYFADFSTLKDSFRKFLSKTSQKIFANLGDSGVVETLAKDKESKDYNFSEIIDYTKLEVDLSLKVMGNYNKLNAKAAFQVGLELGLDSTLIRNSLMEFKGVARRFEYLGKIKNSEVYSDFGHHPTEIKVTIEAARAKFPNKKIWLIFQPHMFSRTKALFNDFVKVLKELDVNQISLVDIYPSREKFSTEVSSKQLSDAVGKINVSNLGSLDEAKGFIKMAANKFDILIFQGAGDIDKLAREVVNG